MKTLTYDYKKMQRAVQLLNTISICGIAQARIIAEIADILDSGTLGEVLEKEENQNAVHDKKVQ
ncbi:hypothetical protein [Clostridium sp. AF24-2LB]|uniref:hypothetical protein n=1 Tax=Clostridium sp. AF24-2LB TaxID=2293007 RepID=UPI0011C234F2|nr:hypothetical protein [Clostridium sp. AF24-2LB]